MLFLSIPQWLVLLLTALTAFALWQVLYACFLSPLRYIPGPFLAKITDYWIVLVDLAGKRTLTLHELHRKYGSAVRVGPNEISFSGIESVKELYGQQTSFMKAPIYETMSVQPLGIFSMRDKHVHSQRRRLLSHAFSLSNLYESESLVMEHLSKLLSLIQNRRGQPVDVFTTFRLLALDIVGELFLGKSFGGLDNLEQPPQFLEDLDRHFILSGIDASFPWIYKFLYHLPLPSVKFFLASRERISEYGRAAFTSYTSRYGRDSKRKDLLTKILMSQSDDSDKSTSMTDREIYVEVGNLVFAGTDTTSTTLTYLFWELTQNPAWQQWLRDELNSKSSLRSIADTPQPYRALMDLPILDAVITEALRLHPAAPSSLQRITPAGGRTVDGVQVPENTIVSMQCYTTQRDPDVFPNPDIFNPQRWLTPATPSYQMKELFMPFSKGPRACLGKNIALLELKLVTAALVQRYIIAASPTMTKGDMEMQDHFLASPKSGRCDLMFLPVDKSFANREQ